MSARPKRHHTKGLEAVAFYEAAKGLLAFVGGVLLVIYRGSDPEDMVVDVINALHINPEWRVADAALNAAYRASDQFLWHLAVVAFAYATVRFVEAYGLWRERVWAEWFALLAGLVYVPPEILELAHHQSWFRWSIFAGNVAIIVYMAWRRIRAAEEHPESVREAITSPAPPDSAHPHK